MSRRTGRDVRSVDVGSCRGSFDVAGRSAYGQLNRRTGRVGSVENPDGEAFEVVEFEAASRGSDCKTVESWTSQVGVEADVGADVETDFEAGDETAFGIWRWPARS